MMSYVSSFSRARKASGGSVFSVLDAPSARQSSHRTFVVFSDPFLSTDSANASNKGASKSDNTTSLAPNLAAAKPTNPTPAPSSSTVLSFTSIITPSSSSSSSFGSPSLSSNCSANNSAAFHNLPPTPFDNLVSNIDTSTRPFFIAYVFTFFFLFRCVSIASKLCRNNFRTLLLFEVSFSISSSSSSIFVVRDTFASASLNILSASATSASSPYTSSSSTCFVNCSIALRNLLSSSFFVLLLFLLPSSSSSFSSSSLLLCCFVSSSMTSNHSPTRSPAIRDAYQSPSSANSPSESSESSSSSSSSSKFLIFSFNDDTAADVEREKEREQRRNCTKRWFSF